MEKCVRGPSLGFQGPNSMVSSNLVSVRSGRGSALGGTTRILGFEPITRDSGEISQI